MKTFITVCAITLGFTAFASAAPFTFSATNSPALKRTGHTGTLLGNGKVLIAGGGNALAGGITASAEIYDLATQSWSSAGSLSTIRAGHTATLLRNGKVLVAGGSDSSSSLSSTELYDPITSTWSLTGAMSTGRQSHTATLLTDGKILVTGGLSTAGLPIAGSEIYDPETGLWSNVASLSRVRYSHTAVLLPNGRVLVSGGASNGEYLASSEIFDPSTGSWSPAGPMAAARFVHTATLLPNGKVLVAGGANPFAGSDTLSSSELYDPASDSWSATGSMAFPRYVHGAALLPNGKVLVAGGLASLSGGTPHTSAELYDPATGSWSVTGSLLEPRENFSATLLPGGFVLIVGGFQGGVDVGAEIYQSATESWSPTGSLAHARVDHTTTPLPNGKILVAGGYRGGLDFELRAELYDPATGTWSAAGTLNIGRQGPTATLLPNGKVLLAGGSGTSGSLASAELYDPGTNAWTLTSSLAVARSLHTATLLSSGRVLVVGGTNGSSPAIATCELYDPATGAWTATASLFVNRRFHTATLLANGRVLVTGGIVSAGPTSMSELFDPAAGTWMPTGSLATGRYGHTSTPLPNGKVLVAGGNPGNAPPLSSVEIFDPSTGAWSAGNPLSVARYVHTATLLPNGLVLITGGSDNNQGANALGSTELYEPAFGTWRSTVPLAQGRAEHTATLMPDGRVLAVGGYQVQSGIYLAVTEVYDLNLNVPAGIQPQITSATGFLFSGDKLFISGLRFRGISEASGGGWLNSASNYPVVQLRSLATETARYLNSDPLAPWTATSFTSAPVSGFVPPFAVATVFVNGIPSNPIVVQISPSATSSNPNLLSVVREVSGTRVRWHDAGSGTSYRVQFNPDLLSAWQSFPGTATADGSGVIDFLDATMPAPTKRFYRLVTPP